MLDKTLAIVVEKHNRVQCGPRYTYVFKCAKCDSRIRIRSDTLKSATGLCQSCSNRKRPFESIYECLIRDHRKPKISLTYEQFLEFTKIHKCHYCDSKINWIPYSIYKGKYISRAYYLDQKDHRKGYIKNNCVVCCTRCNLAKGNRYTYKEWYGMTSYLRNKL